MKIPFISKFLAARRDAIKQRQRDDFMRQVCESFIAARNSSEVRQLVMLHPEYAQYIRWIGGQIPYVI